MDLCFSASKFPSFIAGKRLRIALSTNEIWGGFSSGSHGSEEDPLWEKVFREDGSEKAKFGT